MRPCDYCGKENDEASDSCAGCGNPLNEQPSDVLSPVGVAALTCFFSLLFIYLITRPAITFFETIRWVELLFDALVLIIPISLTFIILYRSGWHPKIIGAARTCSLLLYSGFIFVGALFAVGGLFCLARVLLESFIGGLHP
jgi:hypothetical protein